MFFESIGRHLCVCGVREVQPLLNRDIKFWHVISILNPADSNMAFRGPKRILHVKFHDVEDPKWAATMDLKVPEMEHIQSMLNFADADPKAPLLIHCHAGISRSSAFALALLLRAHQDPLAGLDEALEQLLTLRPIAIPNLLVLRLALSSQLSPDTATTLFERIVSHPRIIQNTSVNPLRQ